MKNLANTCYENVLSGSFIYALGLVDGKSKNPNQAISNSINFFQQTPNDKRIGDLLADWNNRLFIVEFKRSVSHLSDELEKDSKQSLPTIFKQNQNMIDISKRCHFIGYGLYEKKFIDNDDLIQVDFAFQKYFSLINEMKDEIYLLNSFIQRIHDDKNFGLSSRDEFKSYLDFLSNNCTLSEPSASSSGKAVKPISGIVTSVSKRGEVAFIQYRDYEELQELMEMKLHIALQLQNQQKYEQRIVSVIRPEKKIDRGWSQGL